jgi:SAM-dependent methyltransferase
MDIKANSINNIIENGQWYHTILYQNKKSKGTFDYTDLIDKLNFPNMQNKTVLDVGCSDGFFSYYFLSKLQANEVTGVDINKYDGSVSFEVLNSFQDKYKDKYQDHDDFINLEEDYKNLGLINSNKYLFMKKIFDLNMNYNFGSVYDLSKFNMHDVTFCGSLLEHLRDPITALEQLYFKTKDYCIVDISNSFRNPIPFLDKPYLKYTGAGGNFYHYSDKAIELMLQTIGFNRVETLNRYKIPIQKYNYKIQHTTFIAYK